MPSSITWGLLLLASLCCLVPASLAGGLQGDAVQDTDASENNDKSASHKIAPNLADFAFSLYRQVARESHTSNVFFSPVSEAAAFALLSLGAKGGTHTQILQGMNLNLKGLPESDTHQGLQHILDPLYQPEHQDQLSSGTLLFIGQKLKKVHTFLESVRKRYHVEGFSINLTDAEAKKRINGYVEKGTQGKAVGLVKGLDKDTALALVNSILFHGQCMDTFEAERPVERDLRVDKKTAIKEPMTSHVGTFALHQDQELCCWGLLQHLRGGVSAFLLLPRPGKMWQLEARLPQKHLSDILTAIDIRSASLHLPKLSISGTYDLVDVLGKMGITKVFSHGADLSGISEETPLKLSQALHEAGLAIDENGTEHAGPTLEERDWFRHLTIKFNKPFLVIIMDKSTNIPLFMGKMVNPMQN
ncbi:alpha-1-antiproteinase-like [Saccopteryx bilineata]|uniref:alpha-1-antiproteinase-like n=1 Tax=Saccopteryx bilineata TaxID=59482 RepID=UPI00338FBDCA